MSILLKNKTSVNICFNYSFYEGQENQVVMMHKNVQPINWILHKRDVKNIHKDNLIRTFPACDTKMWARSGPLIMSLGKTCPVFLTPAPLNISVKGTRKMNRSRKQEWRMFHIYTWTCLTFGLWHVHGGHHLVNKRWTILACVTSCDLSSCKNPQSDHFKTE